jgi:hypothetical protein
MRRPPPVERPPGLEPPVGAEVIVVYGGVGSGYRPACCIGLGCLCPSRVQALLKGPLRVALQMARKVAGWCDFQGRRALFVQKARILGFGPRASGQRVSETVVLFTCKWPTREGLTWFALERFWPYEGLPGALDHLAL